MNKVWVDGFVVLKEKTLEIGKFSKIIDFSISSSNFANQDRFINLRRNVLLLILARSI